MFLLSNFARDGSDSSLKFIFHIPPKFLSHFSICNLLYFILSRLCLSFFFSLFCGKPFSSHRESFFFSLLHIYSLMFLVYMFSFSFFLIQALTESPRWGLFLSPLWIFSSRVGLLLQLFA